MLGVIMDYADDKLFGPHFNKCIILRLNFCARFLCTKCMNPGGYVTACNHANTKIRGQIFGTDLI